MLFRKFRERAVLKKYRDDALVFLVHGMQHVMTAADNINAALSRLETIAAGVGQKLDADASTIKDDVAKLAAAATSPQAMSEADANAILARVNGVADGLSGHLAPVADAASAVTASATSTTTSPSPVAPPAA